MASDSKDGGGGQYKRFSGNDLDSKAYKQWKLWAKAKMLSMKDMQKTQRGPFVYCLLDGLALETVEYVKLEQLAEENGDEVLWAALDARFPDKLQHDHMAECLKEVFQLGPRDGESIAEWTAKVTEGQCGLPYGGSGLGVSPPIRVVRGSEGHSDSQGPR